MFKGAEIKSKMPPVFSDGEKDYNLKFLSDILVEVTPKNLDNPENFITAIANDFPTSPTLTYEYHNFIINEPIDLKEDAKVNKRYPTYSFRDKFNYRPNQYIEYINNANEHDIINYYLSYETEQNDKYLNSFVLSSNINSRDLFEDINLYKQSLRERTEEQIDLTKQILITSNVEQGTPSQRNNFPFGVEIDFNFSDIDEISTLLDEEDLHSSMLEYVDSANTETLELQITPNNFEQVSQTSDITLNVKSFRGYFDKPHYTVNKFITIPDRKNKSMFIDNVKKMSLRRNFFSPYTELPLGKAYGFTELFEKHKTTAELLYLKIEKYTGQTVAGEPIQTIYLSGNNQKYSYFDTQVKNKTFYTYKITGIFLASGYRYSFFQTKSPQFLGDSAIYRIDSMPHKSIIEYEFTTKQIYVLQPLPLPPKVYTYKHKDKNKAYFHISLNTEDTEYVPFKPIVENDFVLSNILDSSKQFENPEFSYFNEEARFEVFRTTEKPNSLQDFQNSFLLETKIVRDRRDHLFVDHLEYGIDYYYLFRTINGENFPSNPTDVYRVKMLKGVEENKLEVEIIKLTEKPREYDIKKDFNKLFHIYPNDSQLVMKNLDNIDGNTFKGKLKQVEFGTDGIPTVWNKKFKLRVTSNNTGKKIDFNVKFLIKTNELETE